LTARFGESGTWLHRIANGEDDSRVDHEREAKGISAETTFEHDIVAFAELESVLWQQSERVSARAKAAGVGGRTVTLKLKTAAFRIRTRSITVDEPTQLSDVIFQAARQLLKRETGSQAFRLLGVGLSQMQSEADCDRPQLLDPARMRRAAVERAMDRVREKFGRDAILKGRGL
jgi:DNA polymerase-4